MGLGGDLMDSVPSRLIATSLTQERVLTPEFRYQGDAVWDDINNRFVYASVGTDAALNHGFRQRIEQIVEVDDVLYGGQLVKVIVADSSRQLNPEHYLDQTFYVYEIDSLATGTWFKAAGDNPWWCNRDPVSEFVTTNPLTIRDFLDGRRLVFEFNWHRQHGSAMW